MNNTEDEAQAAIAGGEELSRTLAADVRALAEDIGERNLRLGDSLERAANWVETRLEASGLAPERAPYRLSLGSFTGRQVDNLVAEIKGTGDSADIVVVGAHYDTVPGSPGANDNASSVAALLALAEWFRSRPQAQTLRFVAFANEEPPFYLSPDMGSHAYARQCRERNERISAMISMDGIGYYSDEPGSQHYPSPAIRLLYPDRANFIGLVSRPTDALLLRRALKAFRQGTAMPAQGATLPAALPGVAWSDHWSFWQFGYPAFMVTDTLPFRDPCYHQSSDTADRLDYVRMAKVVAGLKAVIRQLAS